MLISVACSCTQDQGESESIKADSGAFEAMQQMSFSRAYPNEDIPSDGFYKGYEQHLRMKTTHVASRSFEDQWESMGPFNISGRVLSVGINPQADRTLYAGTASGGLWRSRDLGLGFSWERIDTGFPVLGVSDIEFAPGDSTVMFIGTGEVYNYQSTGTDGAYRPTRGSYGIGILKSADGGTTWTKSLDWTLQNERGVWMIKVDPQNPQNVYAATTDGIYKSANQGDSWSKVFDVLMATDLEIHPTRSNEILISCGNLNSEGNGIYKSFDSGESWTQIESTLVEEFGGKIQLAFAPSNPDVVYASIGNSLSSQDGATWLYRSSNFGTDWTLISNDDYSRFQGWFSHDVSVHPQDEDDIIAVGVNVWRWNKNIQNIEIKTNGNLPFGTLPIGEPDGPPDYTHPDHHFVIHHPNIDDLVILGNDGGVYLSYDAGETYESANGGMQTSQFYNGFSVTEEGSLAMGGLQDNSTVIFSEDPAWRRVIGGDGSWTAINPNLNSTIYGSLQNLRVFRSLNGGDNFGNVSFPEIDAPLFISPFVLAPSNPSRMYFGSSTLFRSVNGGQTTEVMDNIESIINNPIYSMEVSPTDQNILYCATGPYPIGEIIEEPQVLVTLDGGNNFEVTEQDLPNRILNDVTVDPIDPSVAYVALSGFGSDHLFRTTDFGSTWTAIDNGLPDVPGNAIIVNPNNTDQIFYGNDISVYVSNDAGLSWEVFDAGLPNACIVMDLKFAREDNSLWIATHGNGVYKRGLEGLFVSTQSIASLEELHIYPNPVRDRINIKNEFSSESIQYEVVDLLGRQIQQGELINNQIEVSNLAQGNYILKASSANKISTGKFIEI